MKEMQKLIPKISFFHSELRSAEVLVNDPLKLLVIFNGRYLEKGKSKRCSGLKSFIFEFSSAKELTRMKEIMNRIIENERSCTDSRLSED